MLFFIGGSITRDVGKTSVEGIFFFDPMPGQGVEPLADSKDSVLGRLQAAYAGCLPDLMRAAPRRAPGIMAFVPLFLGGYTPPIKSN